jgi:hypothetical protein
LYYGSLNNASQSNDYQNADDLVESLNGFQKKFEAKYAPVNKITAEILYNKYDILQNCLMLTYSNFNVIIYRY